jgi:hypothetical protein
MRNLHSNTKKLNWNKRNRFVIPLRNALITSSGIEAPLARLAQVLGYKLDYMYNRLDETGTTVSEIAEVGQVLIKYSRAKQNQSFEKELTISDIQTLRKGGIEKRYFVFVCKCMQKYDWEFFLGLRQELEAFPDLVALLPLRKEIYLAKTAMPHREVRHDASPQIIAHAGSGAGDHLLTDRHSAILKRYEK